MADRTRSIPAICRELGDLPTNTLDNSRPADGTLKGTTEPYNRLRRRFSCFDFSRIEM